MTSHKDYYAVLGVATNATREQIAAAYEQLAKRYQPDPDTPPTDPERMSEIDEAFDILDDPPRRAKYDQARAYERAQARAAVREAHGSPARGLALLGGGMALTAAAVVILILGLTSGGGDEFGDATTTASGLKYVDVEVGTGAAAQPGQVAVLHYSGKLEDGKVFDSSVQRGQPFGFIIGQGSVIKGWEEGVSTMSVGGKRRLQIPPDLAYGEQGVPPLIPANSTLIFDVQLLDVHDAAPDSPPPVTGEEVTTFTGLKYIDIEEGTGITPQGGQTLTVDYTGWLEADGTKFDSSIDRATPFRFLLSRGQAIQAWDEGLSTMKVGGKRRLIVPPELGYGADGRPPQIPPNATLIFDVELLDAR